MTRVLILTAVLIGLLVWIISLHSEGMPRPRTQPFSSSQAVLAWRPFVENDYGRTIVCISSGSATTLPPFTGP